MIVWHFSNSIKTKLVKVWKKKACEELRLVLVHKMVVLKEKWISLLFHIQNKHYWAVHALYHQCCHADLPTEKERSNA